MASATIHGKTGELPIPPIKHPLRGKPPLRSTQRVRANTWDPGLGRPRWTERTRRRKLHKSSRRQSARKVPVSKGDPNHTLRRVKERFARHVRLFLRPGHPTARFLRYASRISTNSQARPLSPACIPDICGHFSLPQQSDPDNSNICRSGRPKERRAAKPAPCR